MPPDPNWTSPPASEPLKGAMRRIMHRLRLRRVRNVAHLAKALRKGHFAPASELEILWYTKSIDS